METQIAYIDNEVALQHTVKHLLQQKSIYIDLEFDKNHFRYGFNLCLIQIYDGETCFLIDPLPDLDISPLFEVINHREIELVCFAFNEDMRLLHHIGAQPKNIYDLSVATRLLNAEPLSLNNTLALFLNDERYIEHKKSQQKSNWFQRPLSDQQKHYAAEDVLYLPLLEQKLKKELQKMQKSEWMAEEMEFFENYDWKKGATASFLTHKDRKELTMREWIRFKELMVKREQLAESINRPTYKVVDKNIMIELAKSPKKIENWTNIKRVHPKFRTPQIQAQLQAQITQAEKKIREENIPENQPSKKRLSQAEKEIKSELRKTIQRNKDAFFLPIKEELKISEGENLTNYLLSNRRITEIISGDLKLLPYQLDLVINAAKKLGLSIPKFLI
ncbi:hypothetical protein CW751_00525 [Brumimicrobium salinarum]|uniref:3'-5' exonuclease domain-containing protein n=1 Tax=Brumimicrobium salinarum TaxID=2058658 RepID=A0A2I0R5J5_9FLAO|nr:ribonuclease D [Brumimicrobium salinarum]PKR81857.1 hypothetical protein CW751_00525 [Brumimicrobium salinarum]